MRAPHEQRDDADQREHREVVQVVTAGRDEVQRVLPDRPAGERPAASLARADAVAVAEHVQRAHVVGDEREQERDGAGPGLAHDRPWRARREDERAGERGERVERRRRMHEHREAERRARGDPQAPVCRRPQPSARAPSTT